MYIVWDIEIQVPKDTFGFAACVMDFKSLLACKVFVAISCDMMCQVCFVKCYRKLLIPSTSSAHATHMASMYMCMVSCGECQLHFFAKCIRFMYT